MLDAGQLAQIASTGGDDKIVAGQFAVIGGDAPPTVEGLWQRFDSHLRSAIAVTAEGLAFHLEHMHEVFPELVLDLLCYGPLEKGLDASHGGVEIYNIGIDGAALATVADSMAAIEQRVEKEGRISWRELLDYLEVGHRAMVKPALLSGGEAQRVAIARALANRPRIILADEPTAALDGARAGLVMDLMRKLAVEQEACIVTVTHDEKIFDRFDRLIHLRDGRLADT